MGITYYKLDDTTEPSPKNVHTSWGNYWKYELDGATIIRSDADTDALKGYVEMQITLKNIAIITELIDGGIEDGQPQDILKSLILKAPVYYTGTLLADTTVLENRIKQATTIADLRSIIADNNARTAVDYE